MPKNARRFKPVGDTDSEVAFCILLERLSHLWYDGAVPPIENRLSIVLRFASQMRELGPANFLYADGDALFAHGHRRVQPDGSIAPPGLWRLQRQCAADAKTMPMEGVAIEVGWRQQDIVLLASVPLTTEKWNPLNEGEMLIVKDGRFITPEL